ncbi:hypothetical protein ACWIW6_03705 [Ursidibacter sp. B-7004-1]
MSSSRQCPRCGGDSSTPADNYLSGAAKGAAAGAAVGSLIPLVGTSIGAAVGGFLGFASGAVKNKCKSCGHEWED